MAARSMSRGHDPRMRPSSCSCYATTMMTSTSDQQPAKTDEAVTAEAASALEPAAGSPVETAEDEIADMAEEPNTNKMTR